MSGNQRLLARLWGSQDCDYFSHLADWTPPRDFNMPTSDYVKICVYVNLSKVVLQISTGDKTNIYLKKKKNNLTTGDSDSSPPGSPGTKSAENGSLRQRTPKSKRH